MDRRHSLNYLYFGTLLVLLSLLHVAHVMLVEEGEALHHYFYGAIAVLQCFLEIGALVLIGAYVSEKLPPFAITLFAMTTFLLFLLQLFDFPLMRIMDMSAWYGISIVFGMSFDNFMELLKASNVTLANWLLLALCAGGLILISIAFFRSSAKFSLRYPLYFSYSTLSLLLMGAVGVLTFFDYQSAGIKDDRMFLKALPWKTTFFTKMYPTWPLQTAHFAVQTERPSPLPPLLQKPNIFLFIAESLRADYITEETAPHLTQFRESNISLPLAVSAANATPLSWFSIFHSVYALKWGNAVKGSYPLQLLKEAGYQIHVLSSSQLVIFQMDQKIFGRELSLADDYRVFPNEELLESYAYDAKCIDLLKEKMETALEGHLFIVFLEGTHFDYSWPKTLELPMRPVANAIDYWKITYSKDDLEGIKNRYRHAIYHVDHQFSRFEEALKTHPRGDEAIVIFTSDHGEEFFEEGRIFHASNLNGAQTRVPIYYKLGSRQLDATCHLTSHVDIFPTVLDHLYGEIPSGFDGESILRPRQRDFALSARFNATRTPYEFLITTDEEELIARFENRSQIHASKALKIVSRKNRKSEGLKAEEFEAFYQPIFDQLFRRD